MKFLRTFFVTLFLVSSSLSYALPSPTSCAIAGGLMGAYEAFTESAREHGKSNNAANVVVGTVFQSLFMVPYYALYYGAMGWAGCKVAGAVLGHNAQAAE